MYWQFMLVSAGEQPRTGAAIPSSANPAEVIIFMATCNILGIIVYEMAASDISLTRVSSQ